MEKGTPGEKAVGGDAVADGRFQRAHRRPQAREHSHKRPAMDSRAGWMLEKIRVTAT